MLKDNLIAALIERVEMATGPSYELDDAIADCFGLWETTWSAEDLHSEPKREDRRDFYSDSVDAALGLVERLLPPSIGEDYPPGTWTWELRRTHGGKFRVEFHESGSFRKFAMTGFGGTAPIAIIHGLLATLRAIQSTKTGGAA